MLIEKKNFLKGMNADDSQRLLEDGFFLNLMNGRVAVTEYGRNGRVENCPGTSLISQSVFPIYGTSQCIGSCVDSARARIIFFLYNSFNDHSIFCFDIASSTMYGVLYDAQVTGGLSFSKSYRIDRNCRVVGDMLYWTDGLNPPRRINIEAGIKKNHPSYSTSVTAYTTPLGQSVISLIRRPYGLAVTTAKGTSGTVTNKFIQDFAGQFAHRLIYRDGEQSVIGTPSDMVNYNLSTDTYNYVGVTFPLAETFDQDVQIIQLCVRYDNSPEYFVVKQWDKANATDLAEITAHNNGITNLTYNFFANTTGTPVGAADSVKPADSIPLTTKTLEYAINRLFLANNLKGYNTPTTTSLAATLSANGGSPTSALALKCNSPYQIGIRFRDNGKRQSFVVTQASCIVNNTDRSFATVPYNSISWSVSNAAATTEIPDWAYYYDIVITKNLRTRFFLQAPAQALHYVLKNTNGTFTYQTNYTAGVYGISVNTGFLSSLQGVSYIADKEDRCRLYLGNTSTVYELPVLEQDGGQNTIIAPQNIGNLNPQPGAFFEIYTPYKPLENETYYTIGQSYKITNPTLSSRVYSTTSGIITGDITRINTATVLTPGYEQMSPSINKPYEWVQFYGEANLKSTLGQVNKTNFVQWSNVKIIGAATNGLSTFDALDEKALPQEVGSINKLQLTNKIADMGQGNVMLAICPTETASLYLGETQLMGAASSAFVSQSTDVIGSVNVLNGSLGTSDPSSVIAYLGLVFWFDRLNGCFAQYSPNGLETVSRYKMSRFFKRYAKDYNAASTNNLDNINGFHHIPTGVDPYHKEIICGLPGLIYENYATNLPSYSSVPSYLTSIINRFDIYDQLKKDMAFCFEENKWGSNFNYGAEWYEYFENKMYGWKNGNMYEHNADTTNWNKFYGTQYPLRLCFTGNFNPSLMKDLFNISVEGSDIPNAVVALTAVPNQQITDLASTDAAWQTDEGVFYGYFLKDRLSPNASGTADQKLFTGDFLKDYCIFVMAEWQPYTGLMYCQFVNIGYQPSKGMQNIVNVINT